MPKPVKLLLSVVVVFSFFLQGCDSRHYESLKDGQISLDSFEGGWLLINYWAVWCKPCIEEIPELNELNEHRSQNGQQSIAVLGVNYDALQRDHLIEQAEDLGIQFPVLLSDPAQHLGIKRPSVLPASVMIAPDGQVAKVLVGPQTVESIRQFIANSDKTR